MTGDKTVDSIIWVEQCFQKYILSFALTGEGISIDTAIGYIIASSDNMYFTIVHKIVIPVTFNIYINLRNGIQVFIPMESVICLALHYVKFHHIFLEDTILIVQ